MPPALQKLSGEGRDVTPWLARFVERQAAARASETTVGHVIREVGPSGRSAQTELNERADDGQAG